MVNVSAVIYLLCRVWVVHAEWQDVFLHKNHLIYLIFVNPCDHKTTNPYYPLLKVCGWNLEAAKVVNPPQAPSWKDTHCSPSAPLDNARGAADSPELIDMPPRGCSLITYWSTRPDMQSICQRVSLARWDKCPQNAFDQAVLIRRY